jgi:hypothetical protein
VSDTYRPQIRQQQKSWNEELLKANIIAPPPNEARIKPFMPFTACLLLYFKKEEENSTWIKFDPVILHLHITCITTPTNYSHQHPCKKNTNDITNISYQALFVGHHY